MALAASPVMANPTATPAPKPTAAKAVAAPAHRPVAHHAAAVRHAASGPVMALPAQPHISLASQYTPIQPIPLLDVAKPKPIHHSTPRVAPAGPPQEIGETMHVGQSQVYEFNGITTTAVGDPAIADIVPLSTRRLLVNAKAPGITTIFVFDSRGKNILTVTVTPASNMGPIAEQIEQEINIPTVTVRPVNDTIFLEGSVPTQGQSALAEQIARAYSGKVINVLLVADQQHVLTLADKYVQILNDNLSSSGVNARAVDESTIALTGKYAVPVGASGQPGTDIGVMDTNTAITSKAPDPLEVLLKSLPPQLHVINLINFQRSAPKQVLVRAKIIDIDRTGSRSLGLDWGSANYTSEQIGTTGLVRSIVQFQQQPIMFAQAAQTPPTNGILGGGPLHRLMPFAAQLNALITENKARVLSEPSLLVLDGNEGSMLVGGEFPVPMAQGGTSGAITVQFKPFGIRLNVLPTIVTDDTIQMTVTPEVSNIDFANAVQFNGGVIPGVTIRRATSTLQIKTGDTLVIGGLYSSIDSKNVKRIPLLSSIPIIGEFFRTTNTAKEEHELLVLIESEIVEQKGPAETPPAAGSLENMDIRRPFIPRREFDQDFPDIQNRINHTNDTREAPQVQISLPPTSPESAGK